MYFWCFGPLASDESGIKILFSHPLQTTISSFLHDIVTLLSFGQVGDDHLEADQCQQQFHTQRAQGTTSLTNEVASVDTIGFCFKISAQT